MSQNPIQDAREIFNIQRWGDGYFDINDEGHVVVFPTRRREDGSVDLHRLATEVSKHGLNLPVLFRFGDILRDRVDRLCDAFAKAMEYHEYKAGYTAVYPIKVNQQRVVVEDILRHGEGRVGLEAGSKPELMAVLAFAPAGATIVCNGYKDREYLRLALIGQQLGHRVYIVVEKMSELDLLLREAADIGVKPTIGIRVRLTHTGRGKWEHTGGEKSKFGLSAGQILEAVDKLRGAGMLNSLQLLHFHLGSQIANIRDVQRGILEAGRCFAELAELGVNVRVMDVGGGLGVDYEGTRSRSSCSMNYSVEQYANTIIRALWEICEEYELPHPNIITESGRSITAHHAVMVTEVVDYESISTKTLAAPDAEDPQILTDLWDDYENADARPLLEVYQDALYWNGEAQAMYIHGVLTLEQRARAEQIYHAICRRVRDGLKPTTRAHSETIFEIDEKLADKYFCNFSVFQSLPDVWAIDQVFPIMPIHRLTEPLTQRAVLQDLTCDSDGRIEQYVDEEELEATMPAHAMRAGEPYYLGFFMIGAYQEILGDMHNLFGDTDSVNVELDPDNGYRLVKPEQGDTVEDVLRYVHFEPGDLLQRYRNKIDAATTLDPYQRSQFLKELEEGLKGYTYLEK
ncbi:MAG TPA: biosynthetic arginine decarboxylase [Gammaproteobacteria bacterium]|jgi:arginine decarboxylase|nr:biosynthetic arginine decarboxylase [Gammaproteobacteria bacterium]